MLPRTCPRSTDRAVRVPTPSRRCAAAAAPATYTVQPGDTVSAIAARLRTAHGRRPRAERPRLVDRSSIPARCCASPRRRGAPAHACPVAAPPAAASGTLHRAAAATRSARSRSRHGVSIQARALARTASDWSSIIYPGQTPRDPGQRSAGARCRTRRADAPAPLRSRRHPPRRRQLHRRGRRHDQRDRLSCMACHVQAVLAANGLGWSSIIYPGQTIAIPARHRRPRQRAPPRQRLHRPRRRADRQRAADHPRRPRARRARPRHRDRARHRDAGVLAAQPRLGRPRLARPLPAAPEHGVGHARPRSATRCARRKAFYGGAVRPERRRTRGLLDIAGWQSLSFAQAAQAVQISAYPDRTRSGRSPRRRGSPPSADAPAHSRHAGVSRSAGSQVPVRRLSA